MKSQKKESAKKTYHAPQLHVYGNISELTKAVGNMGNLDGGSGSMKRTSN